MQMNDPLLQDDIKRFWQELAFAIVFPVIGFVVIGFWLRISSRKGFTPWKQRIVATFVLLVFFYCMANTIRYDFRVMGTLWHKSPYLYSTVYMTLGFAILGGVGSLLYWLRPSQWHKEPW